VENMNEIAELLREIRDLLKADIEMTREFRQAALAERQAGKESIKRAREEERQFREDIRNEVHETAKRSPLAFWSFVLTLIALVVCGIFVTVFSSGRR